MSQTIDPRLHAYRPDLADERLKGQVDARAFVAPEQAWVSASIAPVFKRAEAGLGRETEALHGEQVHVFERGDAFSWVQLLGDGYVGYVATAALSFTPRPAATHLVHTTFSHIYPEPNLKLPPVLQLPFMAQVAVANIHNGYAELAEGGYVPVQHLTSLRGGKADAAIQPENSGSPRFARDDVISAALSFLNTPYLWGGKSYAGIDCSGLVQLSFAAAGVKLPRDSDMQEACGEYMWQNACGNTPERNCAPPIGARKIEFHPADLLFWKGHVAIALDGERLIHANAHHMAVAIEPIHEAIARIAAKGDELRSVRRII